jgi:hypothetical protein
MSALVKTSKAIKDSTSTGRMVLDAVERARAIYLAQIKRAEAELFDRIRKATDIIAGVDTAPPEVSGEASEQVSPQQPTQ